MLILAGVLSTIVLEPPPTAELAQLEVVQRIAPDHVRVTVAFTLTVEDAQPRELVLPITIARSAAVVGLTLDRKTDEMAYAEALPTHEARRTYERIVGRRSDPALLEWSAATGSYDEYRLHVFPMSAQAPARITIELVSDDPIALASSLKPVFLYQRTKQPRPTAKRADKGTSLLAIEPAIARAFRPAACAGGTAAAASPPCAPSSAPANR
ncbi:MAG TPA: VIT domain-containing protein [Xanthomonadales bacterium]|nr:VIT domain-containing protein [Xanthomonadales bacterium]